MTKDKNFPLCFVVHYNDYILIRNGLKPKNLENLMFLTLNKNKAINYQSLAYELFKTWKYDCEDVAEN